jgi:hypothetical protein
MNFPPRGALLRWGQAIWLYAIAYSLSLLVLDVWFGFHVGMNDFWCHYYQAENLDIANPQTLYDGFFPIGYPAMLRLMPGEDFIEAGFVIASASRVLYLGAFGMVALWFLPGAWALAATVALSLVPRIFENVLTPGADLPMLVIGFSGASLVLIASLREARDRRHLMLMLAGGALMGASGLIRQHGLVMAAGMFLAALILRPRDLGRIILAGLACTAAYTPQIAINLWAGRGAFETFQYVNIYKMMHRCDLRQIPLGLSPSLGSIVREDPQMFVASWLGYVGGMMPLLVPALLVACFVRGARRAGVALLIAGVPYLFAVALGWSLRAILPIIPWTILFTGILVHQLFTVAIASRTRASVLRGAVAGAALLLTVRASETNSALVHRYLYDHHIYTQVSRALGADGVVHPKQVYSTDGTFYLPELPPYWPYFDGTWALWSLYEFRARYPKLDVSSLPSLRDDCTRQGITHLVLANDPTWISPALGELMRSPQDHPEFEFLGRQGEFSVFRRRG